MGKSDPYIFSKYRNIINDINLGSCCFLGYSSHNNFTSNLNTRQSHFYDISLENWNINSRTWNIKDSSFDSIICTRVAYFCKDVQGFFNECHRILKPGGFILVDWGLGDHWRFDNFKVGWVKDGEHEFCYSDDNYLWSTIWSDKFKSHPEYLKFENLILKKGYTNLEVAINKEVPEVYNLDSPNSLFGFDNLNINMLQLWEDNPQLYIILTGTKK
jgi:SAM-dependent methyltransferase